MLAKKTSAVTSIASAEPCAIEKILHRSTSGKLNREQFMNVLKLVPGLSYDDQHKYAKLFVKEKIRDVKQLSKLDVSALKTMGVPMGDAVEIYDAVMRASNSKLLEQSSHSSISLDADEVLMPDLPAGNTYFGFASHNWGSPENGFANHVRIAHLVDKLRASEVPLWFDHERLSGTIDHEVTKGIDSSTTFLAFITKDYVEKVMSGSDSDKTDWCHFEFAYAGLQKPNKMIAIVMDSDMLDTKKWKGAVGARLGSKIFVDFTSDDKLESACLDLCRIMAGMVS